MKTIAVFVAMLLGSLLYGQADKSGNITATVPNITGTEGSMKFGLYTAETFMKAEPDFSAEGKIEEGKASVTFENVPKGTYAIVVLHDMNGNGKMDFSLGGMPEEDYGTSNNSMIFGPPNWGDANFDFDGTEKSIEIRL